MNTIGIDKIGFYTPHYYLDLAVLAEARNVLAEKYHKGLGQYQMAAVPPGEDIVTMAANAALRVLDGVDISTIDTVLFATETGIDHSKSAGIFLHHLLQLPSSCRVVELKQACYSGTAALQFAVSLVAQQPTRQVLVVSSDSAWYGFKSTGESSQGGGAVAMLVKIEPRLLAIEPGAAYRTHDIMDFWRPNYAAVPFVEGKYSISVYLDLLKETWLAYRKQTNRTFADHAYFCYHNSVPRLVEKSHKILAESEGVHLNEAELAQAIEPSLHYSRYVGNCYTASLYIGLISLLDYVKKDLSQQRIGFYSYGSGCVAEYFSGMVMPGYQQVLDTTYNQQLIENRVGVDYATYEQFYSFPYPHEGELCVLPTEYNVGQFRLTKIEHHKRIYERVS